jgi:hypothetical protein
MSFAPASFFGSFDSMKPSIGASTESWPCSELISGNGKKSRSLASFLENCWPTNMPSRNIAESPLAKPWAASCHVRPSAPSWWNGRSSAHVVKTSLTWGVSHDSLPRIRLMWKS